jgi:tRNA A-37 threonylcarbamoyl transferase component Bud32
MAEKKPVRKIGKYELIGKIAQGGMGALYKARHPTLNRVVLLKKLALRGGAQFVERFKREARLMMEFKHDHIVHVFDHFKEGSSYYIVEEYVEGLSLEQLIRRERYLSNEAAMLILYEVCKALQYAHGKGVIHRDIKPGNILISNQGEVKLVDFGIATSLQETEEGLTRDGMMLGTPSYIPPEQIDDAKSVDVRADIYSLAVVLYEMLTGKTPFPGSFTAETIALIHRGRYVPPQRLNPRLSPLLRRIQRKGMRVKRSRRFQDVGAIIRILERRIKRRDPASIKLAVRRVLQGRDIREIFRKRRSWVTILAGSLLLAALLGGGGYYLYRQGYFYEVFAPDRYGTLIVAARISSSYKEPEEIYIKPVLYREQAGELQRLEDAAFFFHENKARRTAESFYLESRKLYLPEGTYRLKLNLEGELLWSAFYMQPRSAQRRFLPTAEGQRVNVELGSGGSLPLQVSYSVFDLNSGEDITGSTVFSVFLNDRWLVWSRQVAAGLSSGGSYQFRFEKEGYYPQTYNLVIRPYQTDLQLQARLLPYPGTLELRSSVEGLSLLLNDSPYYFSGGREREYLRLEPLGATTRDLTLSPGSYRLSVKRGGGEARSLSVQVRPGRATVVAIDYNRTQRTLILSLAE